MSLKTRGSDGLVDKSPSPEKVRFALEGLTKWGQVNIS